MTRPSPDSAFPYTRSDVSRITGGSVPQVKNLAKGVLKKKGRGTGNFAEFSLDDAVRIAVARELLRVGVQIGSIHSLFASLDAAKIPEAKPWAWLRTAERVTLGAALVLIMGHPMAPAGTGVAYLTTAASAVAWLQQSKPSVTVIVIDVGKLIAQIEQHTGRAYGG